MSDPGCIREVDAYKQGTGSLDRVVKTMAFMEVEPLPQKQAVKVAKVESLGFEAKKSEPKAPEPKKAPPPPPPPVPVKEAPKAVKLEEPNAEPTPPPPPAPEPTKEEHFPMVKVTKSAAVDPAVMSEEERVTLAKSLLSSVPGVMVAEMPKEDPPSVEQAKTLVSPIDLPANYAYMGAVDKAKVLELALEQLQKRNSELLTELEHRTQWEAVRLSTALRERASQENERAQEVIEKALQVQNGRFEQIIKRQSHKYADQLKVEVGKVKAEAGAVTEAEVEAALAAAGEAARLGEEEAVEGIKLALTRKNAAEAEGRMGHVRDLQLQIEALSHVVKEDQHFKETSHTVHRVAQAVLSLNNQMDSAAPFGPQMAVLREVGQADPVISAAVSFIPAGASKTGVQTYGQLQTAFAALAPETRRAALMPEDAGPLWIPLSYVFDFAKFQPKGNVAGGSCEEILARTEYHLQAGNLGEAVHEVSTLQGMPAQVMVAWKGAAEERLRVEQALSVVKSHAACLVAQVSV